MLRNPPNPFHARIFHLRVWIQTFRDGLENDGCLPQLVFVNGRLRLRDNLINRRAFFIQIGGNGLLFGQRRKINVCITNFINIEILNYSTINL